MQASWINARVEHPIWIFMQSCELLTHAPREFARVVCFSRHDSSVDLEDEYRLWENDANLLAEVGRVLFVQPTRIAVRLPRTLAERALAAWQRDDSTGGPSDASLAQGIVRQRAASVALIGLAIKNEGLAGDDDVVVTLDAREIGDALEAADEAGLLNGLAAPE